MSEVLFYHLEHQSLEQVLPLLLDKTLERGWRAVVQVKEVEQLEDLSASLWDWREDAFLPHGFLSNDRPNDQSSDQSKGQGEATETTHHQPIWLCADDETPNKIAEIGHVRFCLNGVTASNLDDFERTIYMFDAKDHESIEHARVQWKELKDSDHETTYWRQNNERKWEKMA